MKIVDKLKKHVNERISSTKVLLKNERSTIRKSVDDLIGLRPVYAIVDLINGTGTNIADYIKEQADITRDWVKR